MLVSGGYPGDFEKNLPISIVKTDDDDLLFHAGTAIDAHGNLVTSGGRVMAVTSYGTSVDDAFNEAYKTASKVNFEGMYYRKDLGKDL
ncbi:MAG: phosphoribosylglycinamide synthetase C domain-containing protein, partial [Bacteroidales bacterium]|nr:phosphoribosylglycinamide synthetase C domain-containing protein [Bacteroidales bacterium]